MFLILCWHLILTPPLVFEGAGSWKKEIYIKKFHLFISPRNHILKLAHLLRKHILILITLQKGESFKNGRKIYLFEAVMFDIAIYINNHATKPPCKRRWPPGPQTLFHRSPHFLPTKVHVRSFRTLLPSKNKRESAACQPRLK